MATPTTITILGYTGLGEAPTMDELRGHAWRETEERFPGVKKHDYDTRPEVRSCVVERFSYYLHAWFAAGTHNKAVPAALAYAAVDRAVPAAIARADSLYADLSKNTTINWLAAHHRYVLATCEARQLLTERIAAGESLAEAYSDGITGFSQMVYHEHVPAEQRISVPDLDQIRLDLAEFVETRTERFGLLRATITGGYPEGFEPAGDPSPTSRASGDWSGKPVPASVAVANTARGW
jgi:hypothetical protein